MTRRALLIVLATIASALIAFATMRLPVPALLRAGHWLPAGLEPRLAVFAAQALVLAFIFAWLRLSPGVLSTGRLPASGLVPAGWLVATTFLFSLLVALTLLRAEEGTVVQGGHASRLVARWAAEFPLTGLPGRFALLGILIPVLEEFLFRGLILGYLMRSAPAWLALMVSTVLFALGHGSWLLAALVGLGLGLLYLRYRNLWLCVLAHGAHNLLSAAGALWLAAYVHDEGASISLGYSTLPVQLAWFGLVLACAAMFLRRVFGRIGGEPVLLLRQPVVLPREAPT